MPMQLSLGVSLRDDATFSNFYAAGNHNRQVLAAMETVSGNAGEASLVIWGSRGAGLTHLLQACSHAASERGTSVQYLPLRDLVGDASATVKDDARRALATVIRDRLAGVGSGAFELGPAPVERAGRTARAAPSGPPRPSCGGCGGPARSRACRRARWRARCSRKRRWRSGSIGIPPPSGTMPRIARSAS